MCRRVGWIDKKLKIIPEQIRAPKLRSSVNNRRHLDADRAQQIDGGFIPIPVWQLIAVVLLYGLRDLAKRDLGLFFAAHEMQHSRRQSDKPAFYSPREAAGLIGRDVGQARAGLRTLGRVGLLSFGDREITFARSIDSLRGDVSMLHAVVGQAHAKRTTVPVPRRLARHLARGKFTRSETTLAIVMLVRCVFWHGREGTYRTDGRVKLTWVAGTFGVGLRSIQNARASLIKKGWLEALEASQGDLNRHGSRNGIDVNWAPPESRVHNLRPPPHTRPDPTRTVSASHPRKTTPGFAPPPPKNEAIFASPQRPEPSLSENLNNRNLGGGPSSPEPEVEVSPNPKDPSRISPPRLPDLHDIQREDLESMPRTLELHRQAAVEGLADNSEVGEDEFVAKAHRSQRPEINNPGGMLVTLLRDHSVNCITHADEDAARAKLRVHRHGPDIEREPPKPRPRQVLSTNEKFVSLCLEAVRRGQIDDGFDMAAGLRSWKRERWTRELANYNLKRTRHRATYVDSVPGGIQACLAKVIESAEQPKPRAKYDWGPQTKKMELDGTGKATPSRARAVQGEAKQPSEERERIHEMAEAFLRRLRGES